MDSNMNTSDNFLEKKKIKASPNTKDLRNLVFRYLV